MECSCSFSVETEVFGEGLGDAELEAFGDEVADGPGVVLEIARCETLVGTVEEGEVLLGPDNVGDLHPLISRWVNTSGVVGASVKQDYAATWSGLNGRDHALEIEAFCFGVEVWVSLDREADVRHDLVVVGPCWIGEVDCLVRGARVEFCEE